MSFRRMALQLDRKRKPYCPIREERHCVRITLKCFWGRHHSNMKTINTYKNDVSIWSRRFSALSYGKCSVTSQRTCKANQAGENSSFIFTVCVKSVPRYHFKLAYAILYKWLSKNFSKPTSKNGDIGNFNL